MSFIVLASFVPVIALLISMHISKTKYRLYWFLFSVIGMGFIYELANNKTNLLIIKPLEEIKVDEQITNAFKKHNLPLPALQIHRFALNTVLISNKTITLPVNYVKWSKKDYALVYYMYLNSVTKTPEYVNEIEQIVETAKKENKNYILPAYPEFLIRHRNDNDVAQIIKDGGETSCFFNPKQFRTICKFTKIEELNLDKNKFLSQKDFYTNLESNFEKVVDYRMSHFKYTPYNQKSLAFHLDSDFTISF